MDRDSDSGVDSIVVGEKGIGPVWGGEGGVVRTGDEEVNSVSEGVSGKSDKLDEIKGGEEEAEGRGVVGTVKMNVKVARDDKVGGGEG